MAQLRYIPEYSIRINGEPIPAALRASIAGISLQTGLEGSDRLELSLVNEQLRWLDHKLLGLDNVITLGLGYAPDPLEQVFVGEIVGQSPTFPSSGAPMLTIVAQDRRQKLQQGSQVRWFAISIPSHGNYSIPDVAIASQVASEQGLIPILDPISAALSVLLGGVEVVVALKGKDPDRLQKLIRKQVGESNYDFLRRIAHENGWEMVIDHSGPLGGAQLRFLALAEHLTPDVTLRYGQSLVDFTPRITQVGQIAGVTVRIWQPEIKMEFSVTVSWDWDRNALDLSVAAGSGGRASGISKDAKSVSVMLVEEPATQQSAPRLLLSKLLSRLNQRLTGSGSTLGDPRIRAGTVLRIEGVGERFGGLYRVTSANHTIDGSGYRTSFDMRKEIWFGSVPLLEQGAVKLNLQGQRMF